MQLAPSRCLARSLHSDNVWTSLCTRTCAERWERQGLCLRGDRQFIFTTEVGEGRSKTRVQSAASARGISVNSRRDLHFARRRADWSQQISKKEPFEAKPEDQKRVDSGRVQRKKFLGREVCTCKEPQSSKGWSGARRSKGRLLCLRQGEQARVTEAEDTSCQLLPVRRV